MAKAKVVHSEDACMIIFKGNPKKPEPRTGVIRYPGGHVEVTRTSDGSYWVHLAVDDAVNIINSRIDYNYEKWCETNGEILRVPKEGNIKKIAIRVKGQWREE